MTMSDTGPGGDATARAKYILKQVQESGVKLIGLWFSDVAGRLKSVSIADQQLEAALSDGIAFDGGTMVGRVRHEETDLLLRPDSETFAVVPWRRDGMVARMFCELETADGGPCPHDPRTILKQTLSRAASAGLGFYMSAEVENYYFRADKHPAEAVLDAGTYFDAMPTDRLSSLRMDTVLALEQLGIGVHSTHHEVGPGQYEVVLQYTDPLSLADGILTYRHGAKQLAEQQAIVASFMPKPLVNENGNGMHVRLSVLKDGEDVLADASAAGGLGSFARQFVAGLLDNAPAMTLVTNPWVNSYKRLVPGFEAPTRCTWARHNWDDLIRVPTATTDHEGVACIEYRAPDPACNPYLAFALLIEAGLDGVRRELTPPPLREPRVEVVRATQLPETLADAAGLAEGSELMRTALGAELHQTLLDVARAEWGRYHSQVTEWELQRYFRDL